MTADMSISSESLGIVGSLIDFKTDLGLTERQADVLKLVARGLANSEIARRLSISENTVKQHAHSAYRLLGVSSRTEAMVLLARLGLSDA